MANKSVFASIKGRLLPHADTTNAMNAPAYTYDDVLAKAAVYTRKSGHMKDMPAVLLAVLSARDPILFQRVFHRVVDNGKMLRTFVQIMRSGQTGRKSLGSGPKRMVANWLINASDRAILQAGVGNDPSLADEVRCRISCASKRLGKVLFLMCRSRC